MSVLLEEKLQVAKKLNLYRQISLLEFQKGMFDLKFKPVTITDVRKRLTFYKVKPNYWGIAFFAGFMVLTHWVHLNGKEHPLWQYLGVQGCLMFGILLNTIKRTWVRNCWVNDFQWEIPYGAMLAQKEAGDKGILNHRIYYPTFSTPFSFREVFKVFDDPIIVGERNGVLYEIYAWNEDDVYEG